MEGKRQISKHEIILYIFAFVVIIGSQGFIKSQLGFTPYELMASMYTVTDYNFKYECENEGGRLEDSKNCFFGDENSKYNYYLSCRGFTEHHFTNLTIENEYSQKIKKACSYGKITMSPGDTDER